MRLNYKNWLHFFTITIFIIVLAACNDTNPSTSANDNSGNNNNNDNNGEVNTNLDENTENNNVEIENKDLAIYADNLITTPTIGDIINTFTKLQISLVYDGDQDHLFTFEWLGEEELNGESSDKIHINILKDTEYEKYEKYADLWVNKEGTVMQIINFHDNMYTLEDDEDYIEYEVMSYTDPLLSPFHYFNENVRDYLALSFITLTDHSTSNEQLFGETVDTHTIKVESEDTETYFEYIEATVAYFNGLEIILDSVENWDELYTVELKIIDYELK